MLQVLILIQTSFVNPSRCQEPFWKLEAQTSIRNRLCPHRIHDQTLDIKILAVNSDLTVLQLQAHFSAPGSLFKGHPLIGAILGHATFFILFMFTIPLPAAQHSLFFQPVLQHISFYPALLFIINLFLLESEFQEGRDFHQFIGEPLDSRMCLICNRHSINGLGVKTPERSRKDSKRR